MNGDITIIDLTPENVALYGFCGYKDVNKHVELRRKIDWFKEFYKKGLRIKVVMSQKGGYQGMLEYLPGEFAHRPVDAQDYMFIHCIFVGFKNEYKGKGLASALIDECILDAKSSAKSGIAVVTRNGSFMAKKDIFIKFGFSVVDTAKPDFELLVLKFDESTPNPKFKDMDAALKKYSKGLTIIRAAQCPYSEKNVNQIIETAKSVYNITPELIDIIDEKQAQATPCAFGTFCIIYNGKILTSSPISNTRFINIMKDKLNTKN
ncbi:MAG: GNAT family N-acetyltransferase [Clostridia bacterium]|nr:GNAT family N-acetyltransferase [Clostridia bacterium]